MQRGEVETLEPSRPLAQPTAAMRPRDFEQRPDHLAVQPGDLAVAAFGHGKRGHAALETVELDLDRLHLRRLLLRRLGKAARLRIERRLAARLQRDEIGPSAARE